MNSIKVKSKVSPKAKVIKLYKSLCETISNKNKVYTATAEEIGFIVGETTPCMRSCYGEAGPSARVKVIWKDGRISKPCLKGMKSYKGGWRLR